MDAVLNARLGGWTQTFLALDDIAKAAARREHSMLTNACVICGKQGCRAENHTKSEKRPTPQTIVPEPAPKRVCLPPKPSAASPKPEHVPICKRVCILGRDYTTLTWYLGKKANESQLEKAGSHRFTRAIELSGGDTKTLKDFSSSTQARPSELLPARQNLPSDWVQTVCPAARSKGKDFVWLRRADDPTNFRQILLPCDELPKVFQNKSC